MNANSMQEKETGKIVLSNSQVIDIPGVKLKKLCKEH